MAQRKKIVFYFRKNVLAKGDFALYYCVANAIAENKDVDVFCVNNSNKEIQEGYLDSKINFCDITEENKAMFSDAFFVTAYNQLFYLLEEIKDLKNAKILLLFLHPQIIDWMNYQLPKRANVKSVYKLLFNNNAYGFMDCANWYALEKQSKLSFEKRYFPVVFDELHAPTRIPARGIIKDGEINIGWFGRLDGDKIYSLLNVLNNIAEEEIKDVKFHLIGDGNATKLINVNKFSPNMKIVFNSYLFGDEKTNYFRENTDLVVAMGISALDVSLASVPTVVPIVSGVPFRDDKFAYIFDAKDYCLGWSVEDVEKTTEKTYGIKQVIDHIYNGQKVEIAEKCYDFVQEKFNVVNQVDSLVTLITSSRLSVGACLANSTISHQMAKLKLYKALRGKARYYGDYLMFRAKYNKFSNMNFLDKTKLLINRFIKRGRK